MGRAYGIFPVYHRRAGEGQVFEYDPVAETLRLIYVSLAAAFCCARTLPETSSSASGSSD